MSPRVLGRRILLLALPVLALSSGCALGSLSAADEAELALPLQLRSDQIIVALPLVAPTLLADTAGFLALQYDLELRGPGFPLPSVDLHCVVFSVRPGTDVDQLLVALQQNPSVRFAQRNNRFDVYAAVAPHSDKYADLQYGPIAMRVDRVHSVATGRGIKVAIIDTGIDVDHPDLRDRVLQSRSFVQGGDSSFGQDIHGTTVAGVLAATADDGVGIYGVAPEALLIVAKACSYVRSQDTAHCSSWSLMKALDFAIRNDVRVVNMSLGGPHASPEEPILRDLLEHAAERSIIVVAAAGDDPQLPAFPASFERSIGAVELGVLGPFGSVSWKEGQGLLVAAPGQEILTTVPGGYLHQSGSSLSTAHVSGLIALMLQLDPNLTLERIQELLRAAAARGTGPGSLDACDVLDLMRVVSDRCSTP